MEKNVVMNELLNHKTQLLIFKGDELEFQEINGIPEYGWYKSGSDFFLNLGKMKKAVVIRKSLRGETGVEGKELGNRYFISYGSYFPFSEEVYDSRFKSPKEAIEVSTSYIGEWFQESMNKLGL